MDLLSLWIITHFGFNRFSCVKIGKTRRTFCETSLTDSSNTLASAWPRLQLYLWVTRTSVSRGMRFHFCTHSSPRLRLNAQPPNSGCHGVPAVITVVENPWICLFTLLFKFGYWPPARTSAAAPWCCNINIDGRAVNGTFAKKNLLRHYAKQGSKHGK